MQINYRKILIKPILTEKALIAKEKDNVYTFQVNRNANKIQIKEAVEKLFDVKVKTVKTLNVLGKIKRQGKYFGKRPDWKKAYVKLPHEQTIEAFNISG